MNIITTIILAVAVTGYLTWKITVNIERRRIAEKLFRGAKRHFDARLYSDALIMLRFIHWSLGDIDWFENLLDTHKTVTREKYGELCRVSLEKVRCLDQTMPSVDQTRLSEEELAQRIKRIWELTEPPEGYDKEKMIKEVMGTLFNKTSLKKP